MKHEDEQLMLAEMKGSQMEGWSGTYKPAATDPETSIDVLRFAERARRMNHIDRLTGFRKNKRYSLAEHGFHVATLFYKIAKKERVEISETIMFLVMHHDFMETYTGDLLRPAKHLSPDTKRAWAQIESLVAEAYPDAAPFTDAEMDARLPPRSKALLKDCDWLELYMFVCEEIALGNNTHEMVEVRDNCRRALGFTTFDTIRRIMDGE